MSAFSGRKLPSGSSKPGFDGSSSTDHRQSRRVDDQVHLTLLQTESGWLHPEADGTACECTATRASQIAMINGDDVTDYPHSPWTGIPPFDGAA